MHVSFLDAWARWGDPALANAILWGLAIKWWGLIGEIVLLLGVVALVIDVRASPIVDRRRPQRVGFLGCLRGVLIAAVIFLMVGGYIHAIGEEARDTGHSVTFVLFAGDDSVDWDGAPRWFTPIVVALTALAVILWRRYRLRDWFLTQHRKGVRAVLPRVLAALVMLVALSFVVLAV